MSHAKAKIAFAMSSLEPQGRLFGLEIAALMTGVLMDRSRGKIYNSATAARYPRGLAKSSRKRSCREIMQATSVEEIGTVERVAIGAQPPHHGRLPGPDV